ncbi:MAG: hypothetical protein H7318_18895 [Oligoflexus sp.]|nr:hypothetical protein [Oligoflexus sp.]
MADCSKGRCPNFQKAAKPEEALRLYELFATEILKFGMKPQMPISIGFVMPHS